MKKQKKKPVRALRCVRVAGLLTEAGLPIRSVDDVTGSVRVSEHVFVEISAGKIELVVKHRSGKVLSRELVQIVELVDLVREAYTAEQQVIAAVGLK